MAWKASSKYKHAVPKSSKGEWYTDISINSEVSESSSVAKASKKFIAFPTGSGGGGSMSVIGINPEGGKFSKGLPTISGHTGPISDLDFSPFDDHLLASGSEDSKVKIWKIPSEGLQENLSQPVLTLDSHDKKIETVLFHPTASQVIASSGGNNLAVSDLNSSSTKYKIQHPDLIHSFSWKSDGSLILSTCKDKNIRIIDPRDSKIVHETTGHSGVKASVGIWLGNLDRVLTTGFNKTREREYYLWDTRNFSAPLKMNQLDSSTGILLPLYDQDTNMLFLGGKGDTTIRWFELVHETSPYFQWEGSAHVATEQQKGITLVPKLALDVMKCEVAQVLRVAQNSIIPLRFNVPRKAYSIFHDDLFPDTNSPVASMTSDEWFAGENKPLGKTKLNPELRSSESLSKSLENTSISASSSQQLASDSKSGVLSPSPSTASVSEPEKVVTMKDVKYKATGVRVSKYKYITGKPLHPSTNYDHLKDLSLKMSGECDVLASSSKFLAVPLNKPGGQIGIIPINKHGRQPPKLPAVVSGAEVLDFVFDPFNPHVIATASDDSSVRIWNIPSEGLSADVGEPQKRLVGHKHRVNIVRFHPLAKDVLITASPELGEPSIKYWDVSTGKEMFTLTGFKDQVFGFEHNYDGSLLAVVSKDKMIRVFDPRKGKILSEGPSHEGARGARVCWIGKTGMLCTIGFDKGSQREIRLYKSDDLSKPLAIHPIDINPGVLVPYFDEDTSVLYLWGRGDASILFFEITEEKPHIHYLTRYDSSNMFVGLTFIPKQTLDVKIVEVGKTHVLTQTHIETVSFTVPRNRPEFFQDDIFLDTRDRLNPICTSSEWFSGVNAPVKLICLRPEGMNNVSEAPIEVKAKKYDSRKGNELSEEEMKKQVLDNMFTNVRNESSKDPLPQDLKEGVDESEWD